MLLKRIIPCLDVAGDRVAKGTHFKQLRDQGDPLALARTYSDDGADELAFLDIEATPDGRGTLVDLVERTARQVFIPLTVGGGIRGIDEIRILLRAGADKVSIQTAAVERPELITEGARAFGSVHRGCGRRETRGRGLLDGLHPWRPQTDQPRRDRLGARRGASRRWRDSLDEHRRRWHPGRLRLELTCRVVDAVKIPVIASGGAGHPTDLAAVLVQGGADAALAASIFHTGAFSIPQTKRFLSEQGIPVRR